MISPSIAASGRNRSHLNLTVIKRVSEGFRHVDEALGDPWPGGPVRRVLNYLHQRCVQTPNSLRTYVLDHVQMGTILIVVNDEDANLHIDMVVSDR